MAHLSPKKRRAIIRDNILLHTEQELAKMCNVSRRTIIRDISKWRKDGGFTEFLVKEFFPLYSKEKLTNPSKALDRICYLMTKELQYGGLPASVDEIRLKWAMDELNSNNKVHST